jgi:hypothetical protein
MHVRSSAAAVVLFAGLTIPMTGSAFAADLDCKDFSSQAAAQANLTANPSDPNGLDANHNGIACEDFNYGSASTGGTQVPTVPQGGVPAGDGSTAAGRAADGSATPYVLGGLALVAAGGAAVAARRSARGIA